MKLFIGDIPVECVQMFKIDDKLGHLKILVQCDMMKSRMLIFCDTAPEVTLCPSVRFKLCPAVIASSKLCSYICRKNQDIGQNFVFIRASIEETFIILLQIAILTHYQPIFQISDNYRSLISLLNVTLPNN